jgi:IS605 OrfB family transposase
MDKGYTEGFYLSDGRIVAQGLGDLLTKKSDRIAKVNKNRSRLAHHAKNHKDKKTKARIDRCNLGRTVQNQKLQRDKAEIKGLIRHGLRQVLTEPTVIYAEDLSSPIKNKTQSKRINRKLNNWVKGELQASLEEIGKLTGSTVKTVNPAYTSQTDCLTGTLLGSRNGNHFTRYTGEVLQSDYNAARNILALGTDSEITRYMKYRDVRAVLLRRTAQYLHSKGHTVASAIERGWLSTKFKTEALAVESELFPDGVSGAIKLHSGRVVQLELPLWGYQQ